MNNIQIKIERYFLPITNFIRNRILSGFKACTVRDVLRAITTFFKTLISINVGYVRDLIKADKAGLLKDDQTSFNATGDYMWPVSRIVGFLATGIHYLALYYLMTETSGWYVFFFWFIVLEIVVLFLWPFFNLVWVLRLPLTFILLAAANSKNPNDYLYYLLEFFGVDNKSSVIFLHNEMVEFHKVFLYKYYYFFAITLPFYCETAILLLPLGSAITLLSSGYLLGYLWSIYLATALISITFFCSAYLLLFYPIYFDKFSWYLVNEGFHKRFNRDFNSAGEYTGSFDFSEIFKFFAGVSTPTEDVSVVNFINTETFNLCVDYGYFIYTPVFWANFDFTIDSVSVLVVFTITFISTVVHFYSIVYMRNDPHIVRFFSYLSLFTFFMLVLVCANNLIILYVGWEGVGLSSFLLIAFWFTRVAALKAALKAVLINKIGDMFLVLSTAFIVYFSKGSTIISILPYSVVDKAAGTEFAFGYTALDVIAVLIVLAAFVKSAQLFFHTWLADAMEGPTPVSALLHAATMVTAGVYLVIRFSPIVEFSSIAKAVLFFGGLYTIVVSSAIALTQYDIKKIIAYSTCSQLGLMFFACGLSAYDLALYHFFNHAFFKCLLFLLAGAIIHELKNEQDIRLMGGLAKKMPFTFVCFFTASLSLVGFPGLSGALSKDLILHLLNYSAYFSGEKTAIFLYSINAIIYLTMAYTARLFFYVFLKAPAYPASNLSPNYIDPAAKEPIYRLIFFVLAVMSVAGGYAFKNFFLYTEFYFINIQSEILSLNPYYHLFWFDSTFRFIAFFITVHAFVIVLWVYYYTLKNEIVWHLETNSTLYFVFCFFNKKCYFDEVYNLVIARFFIKLSFIFNRIIEDGFLRSLTFAAWKALFLPYKVYSARAEYSVLSHIYTVNFCLILMSWINYMYS